MMENKSSDNKLMVAVFMITYNHEKYIAQAIESVLMQKTNFNFVLYLGEDSSPDSTGEICASYAKKYPEKIQLRINKPNNLKKNIELTYKACFESGAKYIAMLEGDDYWTDSSKLQQQVDFLESHPDYSFCGHRTEIKDEYNNVMKPHDLKIGILKLEDTVFGPPIHTSSLIYRNGYGLPKNFLNLVAGDDAMSCFLASKGNGYSIDKSMSVYRLSTAGTWSTLKDKDMNYKTLLIQLWIIRNYPVRIKKQMKRIFDYYYWTSDYKKIFSRHYDFFQSTIIILSIAMYGFPVLINKLRMVMKLK